MSKKILSKFNYISLPLDTRLEKASEICDDPELGMTDSDKIGIWDAEKQEISNPVTNGRICYLF